MTQDEWDNLHPPTPAPEYCRVPSVSVGGRVRALAWFDADTEQFPEYRPPAPKRLTKKQQRQQTVEELRATFLRMVWLGHEQRINDLSAMATEYAARLFKVGYEIIMEANRPTLEAEYDRQVALVDTVDESWEMIPT